MKELFQEIKVTAGLVAIVGGIARYLQQLMNDKEKFKWTHFFAHMLIGGFTGYSIANLAAYFTIDANLQLFLAGWGGAIGLKAFELVQRLAEKYLDKKI